jgi:hypothetical protein
MIAGGAGTSRARDARTGMIGPKKRGPLIESWHTGAGLRLHEAQIGRSVARIAGNIFITGTVTAIAARHSG